MWERECGKENVGKRIAENVVKSVGKSIAEREVESVGKIIA